MGRGGLDLSVVDQAYGDFADLYSDVLRVSVVATQEQIQLAYFDRRSELFTLLAKIDAKPQNERTATERLLSERKMDSVVLAVRILGDPEQRLRYDRIRQERLLNRRRAEHGHLPGHEPSQRVASGLDSFDVVEDEDDYQPQKHRRKSKKERKERYLDNEAVKPVEKEKKKKKKRKEIPIPEPDPLLVSEDEVGMNHSNDTEDTEHLTDEDSLRDELDRSLERSDTDEMRQEGCGDLCNPDTLSEEPVRKGKGSSGMLSCFSNSRVLKTIADEISGACEDTLVSVDQVFNAFTLTDKDIRAVTKRIDKAKRQLDT